MEASEILLSAVFDKGMRELEGGASSGEQLQILEFGIYFSVDDRESFGKFRPGLVVVGDDHVDTAFDSLIDRFAAGDTAIDRDQDSAGAERLESLVERLGGKSVAVIKAVGNKGVYRRTILTQNQREKSTCGNSIRVVVSMYQDGLPIGDSLPETGTSLLNTGETVGISQVAQTRI